MRIMWCWRCKMDIPMQDADEAGQVGAQTNRGLVSLTPESIRRIYDEHAGDPHGLQERLEFEREFGGMLREYERITGYHETNYLDGDIAIQLCIGRAINGTHSAFTELGVDAVMAGAGGIEEAECAWRDPPRALRGRDWLPIFCRGKHFASQCALGVINRNSKSSLPVSRLITFYRQRSCHAELVTSGGDTCCDILPAERRFSRCPHLL